MNFLTRRSLPVIRRKLFHSQSRCIPVASIRSFSSSDKKSSDSTEFHQSYHDQLKELADERTQLFGSNEPPESTSSSSSLRNEMEMTLDEMNQEREAIYNFTKEETVAWTGAANNADSVFSTEFLYAVEKAREAKALYEKSIDADMEKKMTAIAKEAAQLQQPQQAVGGEQDIITSPSGNDSDISNHQPFTHLNAKGDQVSMVDVGAKEVTRRVAIARSVVVFPPEVMDAFGITSNDGTDEMIGKKGPIFSTARLAGIMGAKRTSDLIPLCHPLPLDKVHIDIRLEGNRALIECECCVTHRTGVEMEALVGASIAALTIYDMVKAVSHLVRIESTELITKKGGKRNVEYGREV